MASSGSPTSLEADPLGRPGRHRLGERSALHRRARLSAAVLTTMAMVGIAMSSLAGASDDGSEDCPDGTRHVTVAAAPEIAPSVTAIVADMPRSGGSTAGSCVDVQVSAALPADVAAQLAEEGAQASARP